MVIRLSILTCLLCLETAIVLSVPARGFDIENDSIRDYATLLAQDDAWISKTDDHNFETILNRPSYLEGLMKIDLDVDAKSPGEVILQDPELLKAFVMNGPTLGLKLDLDIRDVQEQMQAMTRAKHESKPATIKYALRRRKKQPQPPSHQESPLSDNTRVSPHHFGSNQDNHHTLNSRPDTPNSSSRSSSVKSPSQVERLSLFQSELNRIKNQANLPEGKRLYFAHMRKAFPAAGDHELSLLTAATCYFTSVKHLTHSKQYFFKADPELLSALAKEIGWSLDEVARFFKTYFDLVRRDFSVNREIIWIDFHPACCDQKSILKSNLERKEIVRRPEDLFKTSKNFADKLKMATIPLASRKRFRDKSGRFASTKTQSMDEDALDRSDSKNLDSLSGKVRVPSPKYSEESRSPHETDDFKDASLLQYIKAAMTPTFPPQPGLAPPA